MALSPVKLSALETSTWEFRPLSYLYVVYNGSREDDLDPSGRLRTDSQQLIATFSYQWEQ